jgi:hypothetical protein
VLDHYFAFVQDECHQLECVLNVWNITLSQYTIRKNNLSHIKNELNEYMSRNNSIERHGKKKIDHLQSSSWIKYVGNKIEMFHKYKPDNWHIDWNLLWHHVLTIKDESENFSYFVSLICQKLNSILLYLFWSLCKQKQLFLSIVILHEKNCNITTNPIF